MALFFFTTSGPVVAQLRDSFDGGRPRLSLAATDCDARVIQHEVTLRGGMADSPAERLVLLCGRGSMASFAIPVAPTSVIDELTAAIWMRATRPGLRMGLRVVFPESFNEAVGEPFETVVWGDSYTQVGQGHVLRIDDVTSKVNVRILALRSEHGAEQDFSRPYVDAVVLNAFGGPGRTELLIDDLQFDGQVPYQFQQRSAATPRRGPQRDPYSDAFPKNRIRRIVEHRGESFQYLKSLGFDTVLLNEPISVELLREADRADVDVIGPPCRYALPVSDALRRRIIAYTLSGRLSGEQLAETVAARDAIEALPTAWRRPLVVAPLERIADFAATASCLVADLPPPTRGLNGDQQVTILEENQQLAGPGVNWIVAIDSEPPSDLQQQIAAIARSLQTEVVGNNGWHHQVTRAFHALSCRPRAILYRSAQSLEAGPQQQANRTAAMRIVNRMLHAIEPIAAGGYVNTRVESRGTSHRVFVIQNGPLALLVAVQAGADGSYASRGDSGRVLSIVPPQGLRGSNAIRITDGGTERVAVETTARGDQLQIISPDVVELICSTDAAALPPELRTRLALMASDAGHARWELVAEAVVQTRSNWLSATAAQAVAREDVPVPMMTATMETLTSAEGLFAAGRISEALRMTRRADAWERAARATLTERLMPPGPRYQSLPTLQSPNGMALQVLWPPRTEQQWGRWQTIDLSGLRIDDADEMTRAGWQIDQRIQGLAETNVQISNSAPAKGNGALALTARAAAGQVVTGGYAGTSLRVQSPSIPVDADRWLQIDVQVRTGLGFGGPDQGALIYDTLGGPSLGVLVAETDGWEMVRLYRYVPAGTEEIRFMAEVSGSGEAWLDDLQVRQWMAEPPRRLPYRPLRTATRGESVR